MIEWTLGILALIGLSLSLYAYHVEQYAGKKKNYKPLCDIRERVSCTKAFTSAYGHTLGTSNSVWGILFYLIMVLLAVFGHIQYIFLLSALAVVGSVYLAYILYTRIQTLCIICTSIYVVNILLAVISYIKVF